MTGEVQRYDARDSIAIAGDAWAISQRIARTEFVPDALRGKPEAVLACILAGHELDISPMQSLQEIHIIKGRPGLSAKMQRAIILRAGHEIWIEESTSTRAVVKGRRSNGREGSVEWTIDDAKRAKLFGKDVWQQYPAAMLVARASSQLSRNLFADVLAGFGYSAEELDDGFETELLTTGSIPPPPPDGNEGTRLRASRDATRGADTPEKTEPEPEPRVEREEAPLPDENGDAPPVIDTSARETAFDEPPAGEGRDPIGDDPPPDPGPDFEEGARARSGPQQIAIVFGNRGISDRAVRLRICSTIIGREISSGNELTTDEIGTVLRTLDEAPEDGKLPGEELEPEVGDEPRTSPAPAEPPARARRASAPQPTGDPEDWDADRWRAFIASRSVKASELLKEAQRLAVEISLTPPETIDQIVGFGIAQDLVSYCEDVAQERRTSS